MKAKRGFALATASCLMLATLLNGAASADSVQVTADRLNIRKEASASAKATAVVEKDDELSFVSQTGDWYQVKNGSKTGYVMSQYVSLDMTQAAEDIQANTESYSSVKVGRTVDRVNVRSMPMTGASVVRVADKNDTLSVLGRCGDWYQVQYDGKTGYVMGQFISIEQEATNESSSAQGEEAVETVYTSTRSGQTTDRVNLRKSPSASASVVRVLSKGASVTLLGESGDWYKVSASGKEGYISKTYVSLNAEETAYSERKTGVTTDRVNLRKSPSTSAGVARVLDKGASVTLLGESGSWYKASFSGKEGYILKEFVVAGLTLYDSAQSGETRKEVNLRAAASTESSVLRVLSKNTTVDVLGCTGSFYQVETNGLTGYVASEYLSVSNQTTDDGDVIPVDFVSYPAARSGVTTDRVNLRTAADASAAVSKVVASKTVVSVLGEQGDFYQTMVSGTLGYIAKAYVTLGVVGEETSSTEQETSSNDTLYSSSTAARTTVTVNMRREPEGDILFTLPANTSVQKIGERGAWYKVTYGNSTGYIAKAYVSDEVTAPEQPDTDASSGKGTTAYITASALNMRRGAGTEYGIVKTLSYGEEITFYSLNDGWYLIQAGDDSGYVSQKYVSLTKPEIAPSNPSQSTNGSVILADWWTSDIQKVFKVGVIATVTDIDSGLSWQVKRSGGTNHADVQPLTAADTAKMKQAYGGTWSWTRHAIWVTIDGQRYAASMNGMPHGTGSIKDNNFDGHHCIHFLNSRTHTGNRLDAAHQAAVQKAYRAG